MRHPEQPFEPGSEYVLGFAFGPDGNGVLLIRKTKPKWQAGKVNGVGGKIEESDWCIAEAMRREFKEETDIDTDLTQWKLFAQHQKPGKFNKDPSSYSLYVFATFLMPDQVVQFQQTTDEEPYWHMLWSDGMQLMDPNYAVDGTMMYVSMALNHMDRPFSTMTIEDPDWMIDES